VEIYVSCRKVDVPVLVVEAHLQEANKPKRSVYHSKPTQISGQRVDFANSMIIEYFFECNPYLMQTDRNYSFKFLMHPAQEEFPLEEYKLQ
jgi:hypothetical protein